MRRLGLIIIILSLLSACHTEHAKGYLTFSGTLENTKDSTLTILGDGLTKVIKISDNGTFKDTLKVPEASLFNIYTSSNKRGIVFLKNGYHIKLTSNSTNFFSSFKYEGNDEGADSNNFFVSRYNFGQSSGNIKGFMILEKEAFKSKINYFRKGMDSISKIYPNANKLIVNDSDEQNENFFKQLEDNYDLMHAQILEKVSNEEKLKRKITTSGCAVGTVFGDVYDEILKSKIKSKKKIKHSWIYEISKKINLTPSLYLEAGAIHGCAIIQNNNPIIYMEDVGRHNAVDKIAGYMFLEKINGNNKIFYTTGRLTSEMVIKTVKMKVPILISRSGFTSWGVELARKTNLTLIGRAKGKKYLVLSGEKRIDHK